MQKRKLELAKMLFILLQVIIELLNFMNSASISNFIASTIYVSIIVSCLTLRFRHRFLATLLINISFILITALDVFILFEPVGVIEKLAVIFVIVVSLLICFVIARKNLTGMRNSSENAETIVIIVCSIITIIIGVVCYETMFVARCVAFTGLSIQLFLSKK